VSDELERRNGDAVAAMRRAVASPAWRMMAVFALAFSEALQQLAMDAWLRKHGRCVCCGDVVDGREGELVACNSCYSHLEEELPWDAVHPERSAVDVWNAYVDAIEGEAIDVDDVEAG